MAITIFFILVICMFSFLQHVAHIEQQRTARHVVLGVGNVQFESVQVETATQRQTRSVAAFAVGRLYFHLVGPPEVVSAANPYLVGELEIGAHHEVVDKLILGVVDVDPCEM